jgi:hypothetical protein
MGRKDDLVEIDHSPSGLRGFIKREFVVELLL